MHIDKQDLLFSVAITLSKCQNDLGLEYRMARKHELQMSSRLDTCYSNFSEATKGLK